MPIKFRILHIDSPRWKRALCKLSLAPLLLFLIVPPTSLAQAQNVQSPQTSPLNARNEQGVTPLVAAAAAGQVDMVRTLLKKGAGINVMAADGRSPLIAAVQNNQIEVVQVLIATGANLNLSTRGTGTALEAAESKDLTQIAALLLKAGAHSSGKSTGDIVCVRPWSGDGFCGVVKSFTVRSVALQITKIVGCAQGCPAREECSSQKPVGGQDGIQIGDQIAVPSWCITQTRGKR